MLSALRDAAKLAFYLKGVFWLCYLYFTAEIIHVSWGILACSQYYSYIIDSNLLCKWFSLFIFTWIFFPNRNCCSEVQYKKIIIPLLFYSSFSGLFTDYGHFVALPRDIEVDMKWKKWKRKITGAGKIL